MSVDFFGRGGGASGPRGHNGPPGPPGPRGQTGKPGSINDLCTWMPNTILNTLREEEEQCCFLLTNPEEDIRRNEKGEIVEWKSRTKDKTKNAKAKEIPSSDIVKISDERYALDFHKNLYIADNIELSPPAESRYTYICLTFRTQSDEEQTIVTDYDSSSPNDPFREISATSTEIHIWGASIDGKDLSYVPVQHMTREWTTVFVEWFISPHKNQGLYIINDNETRGVFTCQKKQGWLTPEFISIGCRSDQSRFLTGAISALEIYSNVHTEEATLPETLRQRIIRNQLIKSR